MTLADRVRSNGEDKPKPKWAGGGSAYRDAEGTRQSTAQSRVRLRNDISHHPPELRQEAIARYSDLELELKRSRIVQMYLRGKSTPEIAREVGLTHVAVDQHILTVRDRWVAAAVINIDALVQQEIAKLDHLEAAFWDAWEKSANWGDRERPGKRSFSIAGDAAFLMGVYSCIDRRIKLLGLEIGRAHV